MIRQVISIGLLFSLLFLIRGMAVTLKTDPLAELQEVKKQKKSRPKPMPAIKPIQFYPPLAAVPDLTNGYIFNEERGVAAEKKQEGEGQQVSSVDVKDVFYVGSVIMGDMQKGIVSYPISKKKITGVRATQSAQKSSMEQVFLKPGDILGGYEVMDVQPDKIVFKKDSDIVEKMLNDPEKQRLTPPKPTPKPGKSTIRKAVSSRTQTGRPGTTSRVTRSKSTVTTPGRARTTTQAAPRPESSSGSSPRSRRMTPEEMRELDREFGIGE